MFNQIPKNIVQTNRLPFLAAMAVIIIVLGLFMYKTQAKPKSHNMESSPKQSIDISTKTAENSWFNENKFKNMKMDFVSHGPRSPQEIRARMISRQQEDLRKQETDDDYATDLEIKKMEDKDRLEAKRLELQAIRSPLAIDVPPLPGTQPTAQPKKGDKYGGLSSSLDAAMDAVRSMTGPNPKAQGLSSLSSLAQGLAADMNNQNDKQAFLKKTDQDDDYLDAAKKKPRSRYELKAGSYIPAALITGINSDLPGNVNAQVTENVYDTVTGNYLLIPQGARLIGEYNSSLTFGQNRVQVVWNRILFPDGQSIDLKKMQGVDIAGYTGLHDKVDNHYLRIYGSAILLSLIGASYDILNNQQQQAANDTRGIVAANVGQKLSDVSSQTLEKNLDVQPTLVIDPGYKFKVMVMKDMALEKLSDAQGTLAYTE